MKRSKPPNKYSLKKIQQLNDEFNIRIKLCLRAGGKPYRYIQKYQRNDGSIHDIRRVICTNGKCECGCGERGILEPHEKIRRSAGGSLSLRNSIMVLRKCHRRLDGRNPKWSNINE